MKWTFLFDHNVISYLYIKDFFGTNEICGCWVFRISTFRILKRLIGFYVCVCWRRLFQSFDDVKNSKYGRMRERFHHSKIKTTKYALFFCCQRYQTFLCHLNCYKGLTKIIQIICLKTKHYGNIITHIFWN